MSGAQSSAGASPVGINPLMPFTAQQMANNTAARALIKQQGTRLRQLVASGTFTPVFGQPYSWNMVPRSIGLVTGFCLEIVTTITNPAGGSTLTRTGFGPYETLSSISYQNPSGFSPIQQEPGWALASVMASREEKIPGAAFSTDSPTGFGSVIQPTAAPSTIAAGASGTVSVEYDIPLAYAESLGNFQGAVWAGTTLSSQNLSVTFNPNFCSSGSDPYMCAYTGAGTGANAPTFATSWNLYQVYYDQFDPTAIAYLTPDLSTSYYLSTQPFTALAPNALNPIPFANLRTFMSATLAYDNGGTFNAGTDINKFELYSANQLPYWQRTPRQQSWLTRRKINADFPAGYYLFDFRDSPIATQAQGNTYMNFDPSSVAAGAVLNVAWEYLGVQQVLSGAPAIA